MPVRTDWALIDHATAPFNPGPSAQMYGSLAAVLAGFAFAGLVLYLERQRPQKRRSEPTAMKPLEPVNDDRYSHIEPRSIVSTLFFAMSGLTICAFLYGRLAGESDASGRTFLILGLYGMVLAPAVLSLFYALNLVMLTHPATRETAERTRWVVAAVGPSVVIGLLADILAYAWGHGCHGDCPAWASPRLWGFCLAFGFLIFGLLMTSVGVRKFELVYRPFRWLRNRGWVWSSADVFRSRPHYPALVTLYLATAVAIMSVWARGAPESIDPRHWTHATLALAAIVMGVFAFAAGSVLDEPPPPRITIPASRSDRNRPAEAQASPTKDDPPQPKASALPRSSSVHISPRPLSAILCFHNHSYSNSSYERAVSPVDARSSSSSPPAGTMWTPRRTVSPIPPPRSPGVKNRGDFKAIVR